MNITFHDLSIAYSRIITVGWYYGFMIVVILDIISGFCKAIVTKSLDSKIGVRGIAKHVSVITLIFLCCPYLWLIGFGWAGKILILAMIATYGISVVENYAEIGLFLPPFIGQFFRRIKETTDISLEDIKDLKTGTLDIEREILNKKEEVKDEI